MKSISVFQQVATTAARFERTGDFVTAARLWRKAFVVSVNPANENWCQVRAQHCDNVLRRLSGKVMNSIGGVA